MLVVLASPRDTAAERLAARWAGQGAALLTPTDLARPAGASIRPRLRRAPL
jgi:hypothetical protein